MTIAINKLKKVFNSLEAPLTLALIIIFLFISKGVARHVHTGLLLCFNVIIGTVFPFALITDFASTRLSSQSGGFIKAIFEKAFKISGVALSAFICGTLSGFPLGARLADGLYSDGAISKDEYERLIGICTNSSPAFVISGIGAGMRGSISEGVLLYVISIFSTLTVGMLFSRGHAPSITQGMPVPPKYSFTESVKSATLTTLSICGFVTVFSVICGIFISLPISNGLKLLAFPFLELSNAASVFSDSPYLTSNASLIITAFAISFAGLCAHVQVRSFISHSEISMKRYYIMKLLSASISALITALVLNIG